VYSYQVVWVSNGRANQHSSTEFILIIKGENEQENWNLSLICDGFRELIINKTNLGI